MADILIMVVVAIGFWCFYRLMVKEPILPCSQKKVTAAPNHKFKNSKKKKGSAEDEEEEEPQLFEEMLPEIKEIANHMVRFHDNRFVMLAEVEPCNYFLLSQHEQEQIDASFETWTAQFNYHVQAYLQNRFIDLSEQIDTMRDYMLNEEGLNEHALEYGRGLLEDLTKWQMTSPRYDTKRFAVFTYQINSKEIKADDEEELEEKIIEKAFAELYRRLIAAKNALKKAEMEVHMLTNEGLLETLYYAFNRRRALKNKFKDIALQEMTALYCTADHSLSRIEMVKEMIENEEKEKRAESQETRQAQEAV